MTGARYNGDGTLVDDDGNATTPLHEALEEAAEEAIAEPFASTPRRGQAGEAMEGTASDASDTGDGYVARPVGGAAGGSDDEDSPYDSGNDVAISSSGTNSDVSDIYDTRKAVQPIAPGNIFQQYASTSNARDAAERFAPKIGDRISDVVPAHDATTDAVQDGDQLRIVGGNSATLDGNALRAVEQAISTTTHAGGDTMALEAQRDAIRAPFVGVRAPMPSLMRLDPLARTPTPR